jgi:hypothetical protein
VDWRSQSTTPRTLTSFSKETFKEGKKDEV